MRIARALGYRPGDLLENSAGIYGDMRPILDELGKLPKPARERTLRVVREIVGVREDAIIDAQPAPSATDVSNVVPFPSPQVQQHREMTGGAIERIALVLKEAGLAEPRKGARGREYAVRFYGDVSAGEGIELFEEVPEEYRQIPEYYWKKGARGVLKAVGDSMVDAGIFPRDLLFVKPTPRPNNHDLVICTLNRKAFVKELRLGPAGEPAQLISKNKAYAPIDIQPGDELEFFGVVVGRTGDL